LTDFSTLPEEQMGTVLAWLCRFEDTCAFLIRQIWSTIKRGSMMKNPLDSLWGTVIAGVVLTAVLFVFARNFLG
jgi:hypothetical protein